MKQHRFTSRKYYLGSSLLEVLVSIVIVALGLLGLAGLQAKMQVADMEAYQRTQAILLVEDMANRILANKSRQCDYTDECGGGIQLLGTGESPVQPDECVEVAANPANTFRQRLDYCEWSNSLKGSAETISDENVGAMIGAKGCIKATGTLTGAEWSHVIVTVVWQGASPTKAPPANVTCGADAYNGSCPSGDDRCRRYVSTTIATFNPLTY